MPGQYNTATLGLGLHIYGSNNQVTQLADLLTIGNAGAGVRIDGATNTLIVAPGTNIMADGTNGLGIMFAYGKGHNLIQRGNVQAMGENGVALNFDFGHNANGDSAEYRGSWIRTQSNQSGEMAETQQSTLINNMDGSSSLAAAQATLPMLDELQGALVDQVDISGRVAGNGAAISISSNALVGQINLLSGVSLSGDILSQYNQLDENGQQRLTQISFGRLADAQGQSTDVADNNFNYSYLGNIQGINNLALTIYGGQTVLNGNHQLYNLTIEQNAILRGSGNYQINTNGEFVNNGILAPDVMPNDGSTNNIQPMAHLLLLTSSTNNNASTLGQININGNYRQGPQGSLQMTVDQSGNHDVLAVSGNANLSGALVLAPEVGFYQNINIASADFVQANSISNNFDSISILNSPPGLTLKTTLQANNWLINVSRQEDNYSRYGRNDNARQVGDALYRLANSAGPREQAFLAMLDFSAPDGSVIANTLSQLSPESYSAFLSGWLKQQQQITDMINHRSLLSQAVQPKSEAWQIYVQPYGGGYRQHSRDNIAGYRANSYGIVIGGEREDAQIPGLIYGLHSAIGGQSLTIKSPLDSSGHSCGLSVGVSSRYAQHPAAGSWLSGSGRFGVEKGELDRRISFFNMQESSDWSGFTGSLSAATGYRWQFDNQLSAGPLLQLNYTILHRNGITESGDDISRLKLGGVVVNSLRTSTGAESSWQYRFKNDQVLTTAIRATWEHEFLGTWAEQNANFTNNDSIGLRSENRLTQRDGTKIEAGLQHQFNKKVSVGVNVAGDFRPGYRALTGDLSLNYQF